MFAYKPDYELVLQRFEAWWHQQVLDRPLISFAYPKPPAERVQVPAKSHATQRDRWLDAEYAADMTAAHMANTVWAADAVPIAMPNLGPEWFAALYGCELNFSETTSWSIPILHDWEPASVAAVQLDLNRFYFKKMVELTDAYLARAAGKFVVAYTDMHPGGDAIAAFRDPQHLCVDMLEEPAAVQSLLGRVTDDYFKVYDFFYDKLRAAGMPSASWLPAIGVGKYHIPSNDFSCTVSTPMYEEIFLPGIVRECAHMSRNIYHLDGPQALRFLDLLLEVPNLQAIQWVPGAGHEHWRDWLDTYRKIQARGRSMVVYLHAKDVPDFMALFPPEGVWLSVSGVPDAASADALLAQVKRWTRKLG